MAKIDGVYVAAVIPHAGQAYLADIGATLELVDFLQKTGVDGIALFGATGEFLSLNIEERIRVVHLAAKRSCVPVLAGVAHSTFDGAVELGREACSAGAAGLLLMPPYFYRYSQPDIRQFYLSFVNAVGPNANVLLHNIPQFNNPIAIETALNLLATGKFAGIKDSSGDWSYFSRLLEARAQAPFTLMAGNDALVTRALQAGADGVISGSACAMPELVVALHRAIGARDAAEIERLDDKLQAFREHLERLPFPLGIRATLAARGIKTGPHSVPLSPESETALGDLLHWFKGQF